MIFASILGVLPSLIKLAEGIFGKGQGDIKHQFVLSILESVWERYGSKLPDFDGVDEKKLFIETANLWITEIVSGLKAHAKI